MDRLRILTRSDFGHVTHGLSQLPDFKQETSALPHFIIKQEVPNNNGQQVVVKQEMPDPHQSDHKQNFKVVYILLYALYYSLYRTVWLYLFRSPQHLQKIPQKSKSIGLPSMLDR